MYASNRDGRIIPRKSTLVLVALLLPVWVASADVSFGGTGSFDVQVLVEDQAEPLSTLSQKNRLSPSLAIWAEAFEFTLNGSVSVDGLSGEITPSLQEFRLDLYPTDFMSLRMGVFSYLPGTSEFVSNTNFFARTDYEALLTGAVGESLIPNTMVQAGFYWNNSYLLLTVNPLRPEMVLPETDSPWFPMRDVPESVTLQLFADDQTIVLDNLYYLDEDPTPYDLSQISISPELGITIFGIDASVLYYHGTDNTSLVAANFIPYGLYDSDPYDIELIPVHRNVHVIGMNLATNISALRLWGDSAFTFNKSFLTNRVSFSNRNTPVVELPYLEYTAGASYEFSFINLSLFGELKHNHVFTEEQFFVAQMLQSMAVGAVSVSVFDYALSFFVSAIYSLADGGVASVARITYAPVDELSVELLAPMFFGDVDSELGQFRDNFLVSAKVIWRF
jgi:hypothetical protein